jgi:hypothetical protein
MYKKSFFTKSNAFFFLVFLAVFYNGLLAFLNANFFHVGFGLTVFFEIMVMGFSLIIIFLTGFRKDESVFLLGFVLFFAIAVYLSTINGRPTFDGLRNYLVMFVFFSIGIRLSLEEIIKIFFIVTCVVLAFLLLEMFFLKSYVSFFQPSLYYEATRGVEVKETNEIGIFNNALGFETRFSFGFFDIPRTSSVFLEQVSLANFASVLSIFVIVFYKMLSKKYIVFFLFTVFLILVTNNTRTASVLFLVLVLGYKVFPLLPRYFNSLIPVFVLLVAVIINFIYSDVVGDNLIGRVNVSMEHFFNLSLCSFIGCDSGNLTKLYDSGYAYIVAANTLVGALFIWFLISFVLRQKSHVTKRAAYSVSLYFFLNMLIGGTAIYSIKVASLLWLIVGASYIYDKNIKSIREV